MTWTRRELLTRSGVALLGASVLRAGLLTGCAPSRRAALAPGKAPAIVTRPARRVEAVLPGMPTVDGAGVQLTRLLGQPRLRHLDPFVMLDRFHSDDPRAYVAGFPDHPHRGFETVTIMLEGRFRHRDSRGNHGFVLGRGAQWMTAGRGIVHSEMPDQSGGWLSGFQLWVNLPAREKMCPQYYQDLPPERLASALLSRAGSEARVIAGNWDGLTGPVRERPTEPLLMTLRLEDDVPVEVDVPREHTAFVAVHGGEVSIGSSDDATNVTGPAIAVLSPGRRIRIQARAQRGVVLVAAGKPLGEPIVQRGPFVMNTEAEIERAIADYRAGTLDG